MFKLLIFTAKKGGLSDWHIWLEKHFEITTISNVESFFALVQTWHPHVIVFHEQTPPLEVLKFLEDSKRKKPGLVVVTSKYNLKQELYAFQNGADHFLLSSSPIESLKARLTSLANKVEQQVTQHLGEPTIGLPKNTKVQHFRNLKIYINQNLVKQNDKLIRLTPTQMHLLLAFIAHPNELLTRKWLHEHVFMSTKITARSIDAHISKLKKKLPSLQKDIISLYGQGYILRIQTDEDRGAA